MSMFNGAALLGNSHVLDPDSGHFVNAKHQRLAELIMDFDPTLRLLWIPPENRDAGDTKPYAVGQVCFDRTEPYIIFYIAEDELDHRVIAGLSEARRMAEGRIGSLADRLDDQERAKKLLAAKEQVDLVEEARDKANFLWKTPKHTVRMDGKVHHL